MLSYKAVLKYNAVFIIDENVGTLFALGFGAKEFLNINNSCELHLSDEEVIKL